MQLYQQVARHNGGEPDAGRRLVGWARAAGFASVTATASAWCFADRDDLDWWSERGRTGCSPRASASRRCSLGFTDADELADLAAGLAELGDRRPTPGSRSCTAS